MNPKLTAVACAVFVANTSAATAEQTLRVLTYNIYWGGTSTDAPLEQTAQAIRDSGAGIVAVQEKETWDERGAAFYRNSAQDLARMLDWDMANQTVEVPGTWNDVAILSAHPIEELSESQLCARIAVPDQPVVLCNFHGYSAPYQPYQLTGIAYRDAPFIETEAEAIEQANAARGEGLDRLLADVAQMAAIRRCLCSAISTNPRIWTGPRRRQRPGCIRSRWRFRKAGNCRRQASPTRGGPCTPTRLPDRAIPGPQPPRRTTPRTITTGSISSMFAVPR